MAAASTSSGPRIHRVFPAMPEFATGTTFIPSQDGSQIFVFNPQYQHFQTLNALTGQAIYTFGYDTAGRLASVTDGDGNVTTINHDSSGNPVSITAPFGQVTSLAVDTNGFLAQIADPQSQKTNLTYDPAGGGLLQTFKDPNGNLHDISYDPQGRLAQDSDPAGGFTSEALSNDVTNEDGSGGFFITKQSALGRTTTYNVQNTSTGAQTETITAPDGTTSTMTYDPNGGTLDQAADGTKTTGTLGPDPRWGMLAPVSNTTSIRLPSGLTSTTRITKQVTLDDPSDLLSLHLETDTTNINGRTYTTAFSTTTAVFTNTSPMAQFVNTTPAGRTSTSTIDSQGRTVTQQTANLNPTSFVYSGNGQLASTTQGTGSIARITSFAYNTDGTLQSITDPMNRLTSFIYDSAGRITSQTLPGNRTIAYNYDANGNVTSITPPGQPAHGFNYTPVDLESQYTPPIVTGAPTPQTTYAYNFDRQPTLITRPDGQTIQFNYDAAGRISSTTIPSGAIQYAYDGTTGNLTSINTTSGENLSFTYNGSLLTQTNWTGTVAGSVTKTYDSDFAMHSQAASGGGAGSPCGSLSTNCPTASFAYDQDKLLSQAGDEILTPASDTGLLAATSIGNVSDAWTYDGFGQAATYSCTANSTPAYSYQITQTDNLGRIVEKIETIQGVSHTLDYGYDAAGRLASVTQDGTQISAYTYDGNGNRLTAQSPFLGSRTCTYDAQDRLSSCIGGGSYLYTANGELSVKTESGQTTTYDYDVLGNLLGAVLPNGNQLGYVIDGQNRRVGKLVNGTLTQGFLYDGQLEVVAELDGSNNVVSRFLYGSKQNIPDYMIKGGVEYRIISDVQGSPRIIASTVDGSIAQRMDFDEFGNVTNDTNPGFQPFGFAGCLRDKDSGLDRCGSRDYDSETGRWTAKDPIGFNGGDSNLFGYTAADPVNLIDNFGLWASSARSAPQILLPPVASASQATAVLVPSSPLQTPRSPSPISRTPSDDSCKTRKCIVIETHAREGDEFVTTCRYICGADIWNPIKIRSKTLPYPTCPDRYY